MRGVNLDDEACWRAITSRDARFDGQFVTCVQTTGIYCRPSCAAQTPKRENVCFYSHPAAAVAAGFRACRRCRPDAAPGTRDWDTRGDLAARALRAIAAGVVDDIGVPGLAARLHISERHLNRILMTEVGAGPLALARTRRAQTARLLIAATDLPLTRIAFAAGFGSVRAFNDTMREHFGCAPVNLRRGAQPGQVPAGIGEITLRLAHREPYDVSRTLQWLGLHDVAGLEVTTAESHRRVLADATIIELRPATDGGAWTLSLAIEDVSKVGGIVAACRRLLDSDADPRAVSTALAAEPLLRPLVERWPGLRIPGTTDPWELAVRAVVGQQVSVGAGSTFAARLVALFGKPLTGGTDGLTHAFPTADTLADASYDGVGLTTARARTLRTLAIAVADGRVDLHPAAERAETIAALLSLPGIGPWTAAVVALRGLADPDAWPGTDLILRRQIAATGADPNRWKPWRGYAAMHLWIDELTKNGVLR